MSFMPWGLVIGIAVTAATVIVNIIIIRCQGWYKYSDRHIAAYSLLILLLVWFTLSISISHFSQESTGWSIIDNIISNYVIVFLIGLVYIWERISKYRREDREKLSQRYSDLVDRYEKNKGNMIPRGTGDEIKDLYPVVLVGECDIDLTQPEEQLKGQIDIQDCPNENYELPAVLAPHFMEIIKAHDASVIYNSLCIRVKKMSVDTKANKLSMTTQRTYYYNTMVTNRAADFQWNKEGLTVRELFEPGPRLRLLEDSLLSNHLGYNGFIKSREGRIVFVKRRKEVSLGKLTYGDSIGALLKTVFALDKDTGEFNPQGLVSAIFQEIDDELHIGKDHITSLHLIAAYRDAVECGKPQLLFCADANQKAEDITAHFLEEEKKKKPKNILVRMKDMLLGKQETPKTADRRKKEKVKTDGDQLVWINQDDLTRLSFQPDGVWFTGNTQQNPGFCKYCEDTKTLQPIKEKKKKGQFLPMVPSASASLVLYLRHLEAEKTNKNETANRERRSQNHAFL